MSVLLSLIIQKRRSPLNQREHLLEKMAFTPSIDLEEEACQPPISLHRWHSPENSFTVPKSPKASQPLSGLKAHQPCMAMLELANTELGVRAEDPSVSWLVWAFPTDASI